MSFAQAFQWTLGHRLNRSPCFFFYSCADNSGAKNMYIIAVTRFGARLNRLPAASAGCVMPFDLGLRPNTPNAHTVSCSTVIWFFALSKRASPTSVKRVSCSRRILPPVQELIQTRNAVHQGIVVRQRKPWRRRDGLFLYASWQQTFNQSRQADLWHVQVL